MASNNTIYVLYKIVNSDSDSKDPCFNAFPLNNSNGRGPTLASVKQQCAACYGLNHLGPEGYHWRVFVEDKHPVPGDSSSGGGSSFSWWDIQDENASLPVKEARHSQLTKFFGPEAYGGGDGSGSDDYTKAAKGAFKTLGKAVSNAVAGSISSDDSGPTVRVVAFKLLDLVKMHDDFALKNKNKPLQQQQQRRAVTPSSSNGGHYPPARQGSNGSAGYSAPTPPPPRQQPHARSAPPQQRAPSAPNSAPAPVRQQQQPQQQAARHTAAEPSLMDFGPSTSSGTFGGGGAASGRGINSSSISNKPPPPANETRAQKLKREYAQKNSQANRVWDEIDERWVEVEKPPAVSSSGSMGSSARAQSNASILSGLSGSSFDESSEKKKAVGISLDPTNAVGKSASVQAAVHARVNEMRQSQAKALQEVREREMKKKQEEAEEDVIRKQLEPKIKQWSEEHGKKKQLRALLASLHTILWPGAQWKQVTIGDLLDSKKVKVQFHKASRVVHPDKTHHLPPDQRFLAKRIFDALSQAKNEFDESGGK